MDFITRPAYCEKNHDELTHMLVWGQSRQKLILLPVEYTIFHQISPHLMSYDKIDGAIITVQASCSLIGCGLDVKIENNIVTDIFVLDTKVMKLAREDFAALLNFTNTGYEISNKN